MPDWNGSMVLSTQVLTNDCVFALGEAECLQHCVNALNLLLAGHGAWQAQQGCVGKCLLQDRMRIMRNMQAARSAQQQRNGEGGIGTSGRSYFGSQVITGSTGCNHHSFGASQDTSVTLCCNPMCQ
jgi:hypothetical protein